MGVNKKCGIGDPEAMNLLLQIKVQIRYSYLLIPLNLHLTEFPAQILLSKSQTSSVATFP